MEKLGVRKIPAAFIGDFKHWRKIEFFRRVLYIFLLLNTLSLLPIAHELWSYTGVVGPRGWDYSTPTWQQFSFTLLNALSHPANAAYPVIYLFFIAGQLIFLITGILRFLPKLSSLMVYFFTTNLFLKGHMMFTGGEVLASLLLFYLIFIQESNRPKFKWAYKITPDEAPQFSFVQNLLNNTFYWVLLIQVCVLYFFSTLYKLLDPEWISGAAVMYVSRINAFSGPVTEFVFAENYALSAIAGYAILLYGALFPVLVWVRKVKIPFLLFGVIFHLGIAFGMGIFAFGILMCLVYLLFLDMEQVDKLKHWLNFRKRNR